MLQAEKDSGIVEWRRGLLVLYSTDAFAKTILPKYFNTRNFKTFRRQVSSREFHLTMWSVCKGYMLSHVAAGKMVFSKASVFPSSHVSIVAELLWVCSCPFV